MKLFFIILFLSVNIIKANPVVNVRSTGFTLRSILSTFFGNLIVTTTWNRSIVNSLPTYTTLQLTGTSWQPTIPTVDCAPTCTTYKPTVAPTGTTWTPTHSTVDCAPTCTTYKPTVAPTGTTWQPTPSTVDCAPTCTTYRPTVDGASTGTTPSPIRSTVDGAPTDTTPSFKNLRG